jgi:hypothetical protein
MIGSMVFPPVLIPSRSLPGFSGDENHCRTADHDIHEQASARSKSAVFSYGLKLL